MRINTLKLDHNRHGADLEVAMNWRILVALLCAALYCREVKAAEHHSSVSAGILGQAKANTHSLVPSVGAFSMFQLGGESSEIHASAWVNVGGLGGGAGGGARGAPRDRGGADGARSRRGGGSRSRHGRGNACHAGASAKGLCVPGLSGWRSPWWRSGRAASSAVRPRGSRTPRRAERNSASGRGPTARRRRRVKCSTASGRWSRPAWRG